MAYFLDEAGTVSSGLCFVVKCVCLYVYVSLVDMAGWTRCVPCILCDSLMFPWRQFFDPVCQ